MVAPVTLAVNDVAKLLHVVLMLWDHYVLTVQEQAREMLVHVIHELVAARIEDGAPPGFRQAIEDFVESIRKNDSKYVWGYDDDHNKDDTDDDRKVPLSMSTLTGEVVKFFNVAYERIGEIWSKEALNWATSCPVRHLACRSFQIFRCISTSLDSRMLADMLARLSNTIADEETDYQTFSMEILTTLKIIISSLAPADLLRYPQLFWTTCACLNTIHETEFVESIGMLDKFLDNINLWDLAVVTQLIEGQPAKWEGGFNGIQNMVYKGLKSSGSLDRTLDILHRLTALPNNKLVGDNNRLLFTVMANLPHFLHHFEDPMDGPRLVARANLLARAAETEGHIRLAASLVGFANDQYKDEDTFLKHIVSEIQTCYFPQQEVECLIFLMGLLTNTISWFRIKLMKILCVVIPLIDMRQSDVTCHGPDLISPLLRLLQTDLCPHALQVMDHIMTVSGNPMERHHIRMSMASSTSSRAIRKEYERIQSLYGIPEPSGWSIPMPAAQSSVTRGNVHAVFYTCAEVDRVEAQETTNPEVGFRADDNNDSFLPARTDTMKSMETQTDGNMGDILQRLDSLDDFFEETEMLDPPVHAIPGSALPGFTDNYVDSSANLYDQQTAPILRKSLARATSSSSFHDGLAESGTPNLRLDNTSTAPAAPTAPITATAEAEPPTNGGTMTPQPPSSQAMRSLHVRSMTLPANHPNFTPPQPPPTNPPPSRPPPVELNESSLLSDDEVEDGSSDIDERTLGPQPPVTRPVVKARNVTEGSSSLESRIRSGMRRLTGASANSRDKERQREIIRAQQRSFGQGITSPRVPKVPPEYISGPMSNPTSPGQ